MNDDIQTAITQALLTLSQAIRNGEVDECELADATYSAFGSEGATLIRELGRDLQRVGEAMTEVEREMEDDRAADRENK